MSWRKRIFVDRSGDEDTACIQGTRVPVSLILDALAGGATRKNILTRFPELSAEDINAALAYASELVRETIPPMSAYVSSKFFRSFYM